MEGTRKPEQGHSAVHVLLSLWGKFIFPSPRLNTNQFLPAAGDRASQVAFTLWYAGQLRFLKQRHNVGRIFASKCVCVCVCMFTLNCERRRGRREKGPREDERERAWKEKREHKRVKEKSARSFVLRAPKKNCKGRKKEGREENLNSRPPSPQHTDSHACKHATFCSLCFTVSLHNLTFLHLYH